MCVSVGGRGSVGWAPHFFQRLCSSLQPLGATGLFGRKEVEASDGLTLCRFIAALLPRMSSQANSRPPAHPPTSAPPLSAQFPSCIKEGGGVERTTLRGALANTEVHAEHLTLVHRLVGWSVG